MACAPMSAAAATRTVGLGQIDPILPCAPPADLVFVNGRITGIDTRNLGPKAVAVSSPPTVTVGGQSAPAGALLTPPEPNS